MKPADSIASVKVGGAYFALSQGATRIGKLRFDLEMEKKTDDFCSWVVYLENDSDEPSPKISEFLGLDTVFCVNGAAQLNTLRGDDCTVRSFYPESFALTEGETVSRSPVGGRSSNTTAFPYFDIEDADGNGIVCGIGWSGQWKLDVRRCGDDVHVRAGFKDCDFILEPHEKVRSIRVLLLCGGGGADKLRQRFVRLHRMYCSPVPSFDRDTFFPVSMQCFDRYYWGNPPVDGKLSYFETEDAQQSIIRSGTACGGFNAFWLDACWFDGAFRTGVGNYSYSTGFPRTLRALGDQAHRSGMRFILWFEPVRVQPGTQLHKRFGNDGTKIVSLPENTNFLANLGDPEVWQYQFEHISGIIEENGVDIYRQDFNIDPYDYLISLETPDRVGIAQIRFVEGLYKLWDALLERFPGLMIDNCASGGRLLDVETMMRALPLWRSDMACRPSPAAMQNEILTLSRYIPYHFGSSFDQSAYFMRSAATVGIGCEFAFLSGIIDSEKEKNSMQMVSKENMLISKVRHLGRFEPEVVKTALQDAVQLREYWNGDFTALTPPSDSKSAITAYTLRLEQEDRGVVLVFRREEAPDTFVIRLPGINEERRYALCISDENYVETELTVEGNQLAQGFAVRIEEAPGSLLIKYSALDKDA